MGYYGILYMVQCSNNGWRAKWLIHKAFLALAWGVLYNSVMFCFGDGP